MIEQKDCRHVRLMFGSGDYYLFCNGCGAKWVFAKGPNDLATPGLSNQGYGSQLSGSLRISVWED